MGEGYFETIPQNALLSSRHGSRLLERKMRVVFGIHPIVPPSPRIINLTPFPEGRVTSPNVPPVVASQARSYPSWALALLVVVLPVVYLPVSI